MNVFITMGISQFCLHSKGQNVAQHANSGYRRVEKTFQKVPKNKRPNWVKSINPLQLLNFCIGSILEKQILSISFPHVFFPPLFPACGSAKKICDFPKKKRLPSQKKSFKNPRYDQNAVFSPCFCSSRL